MSAVWVENEIGPDCSCGEPTVVKIMPSGQPVLMCLFHTGPAVFALPMERPTDWYDRLPKDEE